MPTALSEPIVLGPITITFSVAAEQSNGSVTVSRCDVKRGGGMPIAHSHDAFEETLYGLEGVTTLVLDDKQIELGPGDTVCIPRGAIHSFAADHGDVAFLAIATPGLFGPAYFQELAAVVDAAHDGPPDPEAVKAVMLRHGLTPAAHPTG
jgi:quercetin dioxygenase-like cupin family protein